MSSPLGSVGKKEGAPCIPAPATTEPVAEPALVTEAAAPAAPAPEVHAFLFWGYGFAVARLRGNEVELNKLRAELFHLLEELGSINRMIASESSADSIRELQQQADGTRTRIIEKMKFLAPREASAAELRTTFETQLAVAAAPIQERVATFWTLSVKALREELSRLAEQMPRYVLPGMDEAMRQTLEQLDPESARATAEAVVRTFLTRVEEEFLNPGPGPQAEPEAEVERPAAPAPVVAEPVAEKENAVILFNLGGTLAHIRVNDKDLVREKITLAKVRASLAGCNRYIDIMGDPGNIIRPSAEFISHLQRVAANLQLGVNKDADDLARLAADTARLRTKIETELPKAPLETRKQFATMQTLSDKALVGELDKLFKQIGATE